MSGAFVYRCMDKCVHGVYVLHSVEEDERTYYLKTVATRKQLAKSRRAKKEHNIRGQDKVSSAHVLCLTTHTSPCNYTYSSRPTCIPVKVFDASYHRLSIVLFSIRATEPLKPVGLLYQQQQPTSGFQTVNMRSEHSHRICSSSSHSHTPHLHIYIYVASRVSILISLLDCVPYDKCLIV